MWLRRRDPETKQEIKQWMSSDSPTLEKKVKLNRWWEDHVTIFLDSGIFLRRYNT